MSIPYRDEQILRILAANPAGLTTGQILAIAKTQRGNELPDSNIISQRIYAMRETKTPKVESFETPAGRVHKITDAGRKIVGELGTHNLLDSPAQPTAAEQTQGAAGESTTTLRPDTDDNQSAPDDPVDILHQFDQACRVIRDGLVAALETRNDAVKIADKRAKIELLEKIENMPLLEIWASELIGEIRRDLEQFDAA
jgi:hypothetical protein